MTKAKTSYVKYTGRDDIRVLDAHDLRRGGIDGGFSKTEFARDIPVEVSTEVANAIVGHGHLFGTFELVEVERDAPEEKNEKNEKSESADSK